MVKLWEPSMGALMNTFTGHAEPVLSVAWSPDNTTLACQSPNAIIQWTVADGKALRISTSLPGNEWLTYEPRSLAFAASLQRADYAAVRFAIQLRPVYPLAWYGKKATHGAAEIVESAPGSKVIPKPIRYTWTRLENKGIWFSSFSAPYLAAAPIGLVLAHRNDPARVARQFFRAAGFGRVEAKGPRLLLLSSVSGDAVAVLPSEGSNTPPIPVTAEKTYRAGFRRPCARRETAAGHPQF